MTQFHTTISCSCVGLHPQDKKGNRKVIIFSIPTPNFVKVECLSSNLSWAQYCEGNNYSLCVSFRAVNTGEPVKIAVTSPE